MIKEKSLLVIGQKDKCEVHEDDEKRHLLIYRKSNQCHIKRIISMMNLKEKRCLKLGPDRYMYVYMYIKVYMYFYH
jgi:hypothetical protein